MKGREGVLFIVGEPRREPAPRAGRVRGAWLCALLCALGCGRAGVDGAPGGGARGVGAVASGVGYRAVATADHAPDAAMAPYFAAAIEGGSRAGRVLRADRALTEAAGAIAGRIAASEGHRAPTARSVQSLAWAAGCPDPQPALSLVTANGDIPSGVVADAVARDAAGAGEPSRVGVGLARASDGTRVVAVLLSQRRVLLDGEVPRRASVGSRLQLRGQLAAGFASPELAVTDPTGRTERFGLGEGPTFVGQIPLVTRGAWQVELLAAGQGGTTVAANFPLFVEVEPTTAEDEAGTRANEQPGQVSDRLFALINEARAARGRPALQRMVSLSNVALAHSEDMARSGYFAHNNQAGRTPGDRVVSAGIQSGLVLENIARGASSDEVHRGLMDSPGHRANIENERVTHVGIGVTIDPRAAGGFVVTENFIEVAAAVDTQTSPQRIIDRINQVRTRRGVTSVAARPQLMEAASRAAAGFFGPGAPTQQRVVEQVNRDLGRAGLVFRRVEVLATVVTQLEDAMGLEPLFNYEVSGVGVGIAQGTRAGLAPNSIFVVYVLGYPR